MTDLSKQEGISQKWDIPSCLFFCFRKREVDVDDRTFIQGAVDRDAVLFPIIGLDPLVDVEQADRGI